VATAAENPSSAEIAQDIHDVISAYLPELVQPPGYVQTLTPLQVPAGSPINISSAFLQLAYPWLKTSGSSLLLEQLEPPDGALAGLIARNALTRGTFTSATKIIPAEIYEVSPVLPAQEMQSSATALVWGPGSVPKALIERLCLFGKTAGGLRLLSDVTAYPGETYRSAPVNRLVSVICRAARVMGESAVFVSNGPALWGKVQRFLQNLLTRLWTLNALDGATVAEAFSVRCDQSTMTQNDLDTGTLIAVVTFTAAATLETLHVQLALEAGGTSGQEIASNLSSPISARGNVSAASLSGLN
jgi:phage tail sheath protein FI